MSLSKRPVPDDVPGPLFVVVGTAIAGTLLLVPALLVGVGRAGQALLRIGKRLTTKLAAVDRI